MDTLLKAKIPGIETGIEIKKTLCDICCPGMHCGVDAYVKDAVVIKVEGTKGHPLNDGKLCTKGLANRQYIYRKDRLKEPMRRIGKRGEGKFEIITWEEAYKEISIQLNKVKDTIGGDSVMFFTGYPKWYRQYFKRFAYSFGSINYGTESSSCYRASTVAWNSTAGTLSGPDYGNANTILGFGMNGFHSSYLSSSGRLAMKAKGTKFIIVDPRKTPATEKLADIHLQIKAGTDGALALGMAKIMIDNDWIDHEFINKYTYGFEEYKKSLEEYNLTRVAKITGLREEDIYEATKLYATNGPATINESSSPMIHHSNGFQNYRAMISLHALSGNFDRIGGTIPEESTFYDQMAGYKMHESEYYLERQPTERKSTSVGAERFPLWTEFTEEVQAMDMTRHILEEKPYPIKAVFALGMNAKMFPNTPELYKAIEKLDFFVDSDLFMTDTAKYADILLPASSSFERGEFKAYPGGYATFTNPVIKPLYNSKPDTQILQELANYMNIDDDLLKQGYDKMIEFMIRDLSITVDQLKASEMPVYVPESRPEVAGEFLAKGFPTPSGKFEFYSNAIAKYKDKGLNPLPAWEDPFTEEELKEYPFKLVTGARLPHAIHSRLHDVPWLRSLREVVMADISHKDAEKMGLKEGDLVSLSTSIAKLKVAVHPSVKIQPGEVHLYHGYSEANANDLIPNTTLDPYSGYPAYKSTLCKMIAIKK